MLEHIATEPAAKCSCYAWRGVLHKAVVAALLPVISDLAGQALVAVVNIADIGSTFCNCCIRMTKVAGAMNPNLVL